jgi:hypothetical protein
LLSERIYDNTDWFATINKAKEEGYSLNCRYKASLFVQLMLAHGFRARWVLCLPDDSICKGRHCVCEVFVISLNKWVVVDVAYNLVYFNKKGVLLNLIEMRNLIINNERFRYFTDEPYQNDYIWGCWCCHIFRFQYLLYNKYNMLNKDRRIAVYLNPNKYEITHKLFDNVGLDENNHMSFDNESLFY